MFKITNYTDNDDVKVIAEKGSFQVVEFQRDLSVSPFDAQVQYFMTQMNAKKKQLLINLQNADVTIQAGAMQWMLGDVKATTGIKGAGDFLGKMIKGSVTGEAAIKPEYKGTGMLALEPTYKHILLLDVSEWGGQVVIDDGFYLASEDGLKQKLVARSNFSSAVAGGEGLFNLSLVGNGVAALESPVPQEELIEVELKDDVLKIDGNLAIAWSSSLNFTVERSGKSLIGSAASGEGLVNVYRGTGKVLMTPVRSMKIGALEGALEQ